MTLEGDKLLYVRSKLRKSIKGPQNTGFGPPSPSYYARSATTVVSESTRSFRVKFIVHRSGLKIIFRESLRDIKNEEERKGIRDQRKKKKLRCNTAIAYTAFGGRFSSSEGTWLSFSIVLYSASDCTNVSVDSIGPSRFSLNSMRGFKAKEPRDAEPRDRRSDHVREQEDEERAAQLAQVRARHHDLIPGRIPQVPDGDGRGDGVLEVSVGVQGDGVCRHEPDESPQGKDDFGPRPHGFEEEDEAHRRGFPVALRLVHQRGIRRVEFQVAEEESDHGGEGEEDRGDDERVIIVELGDQGQVGGEGSVGVGGFIKDVHQGIHATQFLHVVVDNVPGDDASDEFDHAIGDAGDAEDGNDAVGLVIVVVGVAVAFLLLHPFRRLQMAAGADIDDQQDGGEQIKKPGWRPTASGGWESA